MSFGFLLISLCFSVFSVSLLFHKTVVMSSGSRVILPHIPDTSVTYPAVWSLLGYLSTLCLCFFKQKRVELDSPYVRRLFKGLNELSKRQLLGLLIILLFCSLILLISALNYFFVFTLLEFNTLANSQSWTFVMNITTSSIS